MSKILSKIGQKKLLERKIGEKKKQNRLSPKCSAIDTNLLFYLTALYYIIAYITMFELFKSFSRIDPRRYFFTRRVVDP